MGSLAKWTDQRYKLIQLRHELRASQEEFEVRTKGHNFGSEDWDQAYGDFKNESDILLAEIGAIETERHFKRALYWRAPIPAHPTEYGGDNEFWAWNRVLGGYHLTTRGMKEIRHAVAAEIDLYSRPWISWGAVVISFLALIVSLLR